MSLVKNIIKSKNRKIISSEEALKDVEPFVVFPKIEIPCTNKCIFCGDTAKINQSQIDNERNLLVMEWICDCGRIHETSVIIKYI